MPLPGDAGEAIVDYVRYEQKGTDRALFVSMRPPFRRFPDGQIAGLTLKAAFAATGMRPPGCKVGAYMLRHSLATDLLRKGASFEEIGDVLRHRAPMTTTIYARHDVGTLRGLARRWPGRASTGAAAEGLAR